ncbi:uncharacterized protein LOC107305443 [Oryza brachyantha]|uniref:Uncharacterized protein n=1 Tax=Oryza brachyantha TaxID=4533 RepID=J3NCZ3_ORYBR|nr:uncharacterized protein LOC107305443 [Oryza brachyantha]
MEKATRRRRRRHVPAFGEWNKNYGDEPWPQAGVGGVVIVAEPEPEACSEAWFSYPGRPTSRKTVAPPPPPPRVKARRPGRERPRDDGGKGRLQEEAAPRLSDHSYGLAKKAAVRESTRRPAVDADLYRVPPPPPDDVACKRPRKRAVRGLWMGCLGLDCVA